MTAHLDALIVHLVGFLKVLQRVIDVLLVGLGLARDHLLDLARFGIVGHGAFLGFRAEYTHDDYQRVWMCGKDGVSSAQSERS